MRSFRKKQLPLRIISPSINPFFLQLVFFTVFMFISYSASGADVYVAGFYQDSKNAWKACYWKNRTITNLPAFADTYFSYIFSITVAGKDVYTAGYIDDSGARAYYWKNTERIELHPIGALDSYAKSIIVTD